MYAAQSAGILARSFSRRGIAGLIESKFIPLQALKSMQFNLSLSFSKEIHAASEIAPAIALVLQKVLGQCEPHLLDYDGLRTAINDCLNESERNTKRRAEKRKIIHQYREECNQKIRSLLGNDGLLLFCPVCKRDELDMALLQLGCKHRLCRACRQEKVKIENGLTHIQCPCGALTTIVPPE